MEVMKYILDIRGMQKIRLPGEDRCDMENYVFWHI
jgi:hypothetical protein